MTCRRTLWSVVTVAGIVWHAVPIGILLALGYPRR